MKPRMTPALISKGMSRPARGAWIETCAHPLYNADEKSRPARGAWIETLLGYGQKLRKGRRAPRGARGLKLKS